MSQHPDESKRLLSDTIAEWACSLKFEHLSPEAIQAAKLFWFDSIGCALGGSQQDDAKILLKHYRAMSGGPAGGSKSTAFVSGFKTNPVDASFLNGHMIRAMDYNDIYLESRSVSSQRSYRCATGPLRERGPDREGSDPGHHHRLRD